MSTSDVLLLASVIIDALGLALNAWASLHQKPDRPTPGCESAPETKEGR